MYIDDKQEEKKKKKKKTSTNKNHPSNHLHKSRNYWSVPSPSQDQLFSPHRLIIFLIQPNNQLTPPVTICLYLPPLQSCFPSSSLHRLIPTPPHKTNPFLRPCSYQLIFFTQILTLPAYTPLSLQNHLFHRVLSQSIYASFPSSLTKLTILSSPLFIDLYLLCLPSQNILLSPAPSLSAYTPPLSPHKTNHPLRSSPYRLTNTPLFFSKPTIFSPALSLSANIPLPPFLHTKPNTEKG